MKREKIYVIIETFNGVPDVAGGALTIEQAEITADKIADRFLMFWGNPPKISNKRYPNTTPTEEPREIRRYEFRRGSAVFVISVLEMLAATNPDY